MNRPASILVIDDDEFLVALVEACLQAQGYTVLSVGDGAAGLAQVARKRPDAIVLDTVMPRLDGHQVLRALKADASLATIPVLMLTARRREDDVVGAHTLGATDYLVKPFDIDELIARVSRLVRPSADPPRPDWR